jgi:hypothetical protein
LAVRNTDKNEERHETPAFHASQEWAEERFVMVFLQGYEAEIAAPRMNTT